MKKLACILPALLLAGCEIPGQKTKDAAAMGYACRVSKKSPEQCMRENPPFSQTAILDGWREADMDVKDKKVDTNFLPPPPVVIKPPAVKKEGEAGAEGEKKPEGEVPPEEEKKPEAKPVETPKPAEPQKPVEPPKATENAKPAEHKAAEPAKSH